MTTVLEVTVVVMVVLVLVLVVLLVPVLPRRSNDTRAWLHTCSREGERGRDYKPPAVTQQHIVHYNAQGHTVATQGQWVR